MHNRVLFENVVKLLGSSLQPLCLVFKIHLTEPEEVLDCLTVLHFGGKAFLCTLLGDRIWPSWDLAGGNGHHFQPFGSCYLSDWIGF